MDVKAFGLEGGRSGYAGLMGGELSHSEKITQGAGGLGIGAVMGTGGHFAVRGGLGAASLKDPDAPVDENRIVSVGFAWRAQSALNLGRVELNGDAGMLVPIIPHFNSVGENTERERRSAIFDYNAEARVHIAHLLGDHSLFLSGGIRGREIMISDRVVNTLTDEVTSNSRRSGKTRLTLGAGIAF